ncbi:RNase III domain-containing protein [Xylaria sp. CBS 124048]|nr:RNase III domain-containing protein [Xylaria sp. CBS 124048]
MPKKSHFLKQPLNDFTFRCRRVTTTYHSRQSNNNSAAAMASTTSRSAVNLSRQVLRHYRAQNAPSVACPLVPTCSRPFTTSASRSSEEAFAFNDRPEENRPRWSYTPERMKAPFRIGVRKTPLGTPWVVNTDPQKLEDALNNFIGRDGQRLLPDELKWLAVTHKSFDQARRGFNDRLGFLGRQICVMEAMQAIVIVSPKSYESITSDPFADRREPFDDPGLRSLDNLCNRQPMDILSLQGLSKLAVDTGLSKVVRWTPRMTSNAMGSGFKPVMAGAIYAIVGAIALQNGGKIASKIARERVVRKLL